MGGDMKISTNDTLKKAQAKHAVVLKPITPPKKSASPADYVVPSVREWEEDEKL